MKKVQIIAIIIASIILAIALLASVFQGLAKGKNSYPHFAVLSEVLYLIDRNYVEEVDFSKAEDSIYIGLVKGLGGEASFLDKKDLDYYYNPNVRGDADVGIIVANFEGYLKIVNVRKNSPADKAGIKIGNYIYSIDEEPFFKISLYRAKSLLKGQEGSTVRIKVIEQRGRKPISYEIKREIIDNNDMENKLLQAEIAYIHLYDINENTYNRLLNELTIYKNDAVENLIIDLRKCYSEDYQVVRKAASLFLQNDAIVYKVKKRNGGVIRYRAEKDNFVYQGNIYLIIDSSTVKGCEAFASVLKDYAKAYAIGIHTFGNAAEQNLINIDKEHAVLLDTGIILMNNDKPIQPDGIDPDEEYKMSSMEKMNEIIESDEIINKLIEEITSKKLKKVACSNFSIVISENKV